MFLTDRPIKSQDEDILGRGDFAKSLADAIIKYNSVESLVIGLYGGWGFGKTSIINMMLQSVSKATSKTENIPIVFKFYPWNFSGSNLIIPQFFKQLSHVFSNKREYEALVNDLKELASFFYYSLDGDEKKECRPFLEQTDINLIKQRIHNIFRDFDSKIIITIDDIDRLDSKEIRQIFQIIKSLANFPNTVYILSFNKNVVLKTIEESVKGCSGSDYLEDIIQVPFVIPAIPESKVNNLLYQEIIELLGKNKDSFLPEYWKIIFNDGLKGFFKDIRSINRYLNVLKFDYELVKGEVNLIEFFAITALQVFEPYVYNEIKHNKDLFCYGQFINKPLSDEALDKLNKDSFNSIISKRERISEEELKDLISWLFPKCDYLCGHSHPDAELSKYKIDSSIDDPNNFETYFKSSILDTQISSKKINNLISGFKDTKLFEEELLKLEDYEISDFISRMMNPIQASNLNDYIININKEEILTIISCLARIGDRLHNELLVDINKICNAIVFFIKKFDDMDERFEILKEIFEQSKESIYINSSVAYNCIVNRVIMKQEHIFELREIIKNIVECYDKLYKHVNLAPVLINMKKLGYRGQVNLYAEKMKQSDEGLITLLSTFLSKGERLKGMGIRSDNIRILIPLVELSARLKHITAGKKLSKLDEHKKYVLTKIINVLKGENMKPSDV